MMPAPTDTHKHKFIFIGGLHRSGTSLLFQILRGHPQISGFNNTGVPEDEGAHLQTLYTPPKALGRAGFFALHPDAHQDDRSSLVTDDNRQKLWDEWRPYWNTDFEYLLEKSPGNILLTRFLQEMFPNTYFVVIVRHPIAVSLATRRWFWFYQRGYYRIDKLIENWVVAHEHFQQDKPHLKHVQVIRFEDLITQPDQVVASIYRFLQLPTYTHAIDIKPDANIKYHREWGALHRNILSRAFIGYIKRRYGERIQAFGYDLDWLDL